MSSARFPRAGRRGWDRPGGFTLLEVMLAAAAAALILVAVYGVFERAVRLRDTATAHLRVSRERLRAVSVIRRDLQNALISGGVLASVLEGDSQRQSALGGSRPGFLKLTTTTGRDAGSVLYGDVQQVEYLLLRPGEATTGGRAGHATPLPTPANNGDRTDPDTATLVRVVTRDLLAGAALPTQEALLPRVRSFQVSFYDGANWQESWQGSADLTAATTGGTSTSASTGSPANGTTGAQLPRAIRLDIQQAAASPKDPVPPPLEILLPWPTQPFATPSPAPASAL